jgi:hypothetical protein
MNST